MKVQWFEKTKKIYFFQIPVLNSKFQPFYISREYDLSKKKFINDWNVMPENQMAEKYGIKISSPKKPIRRIFHAVDNTLILLDKAGVK